MRDPDFYDVMPVSDWFTRGTVTMIYAAPGFYKTHLLDMAYCLDAPSVMPAGSLLRDYVDWGEGEEPFFMASQTTADREPL